MVCGRLGLPDGKVQGDQLGQLSACGSLWLGSTLAWGWLSRPDGQARGRLAQSTGQAGAWSVGWASKVVQVMDLMMNKSSLYFNIIYLYLDIYFIYNISRYTKYTYYLDKIYYVIAQIYIFQHAIYMEIYILIYNISRYTKFTYYLDKIYYVNAQIYILTCQGYERVWYVSILFQSSSTSTLGKYTYYIDKNIL